MDRNFRECLRHVLRLEGGWVLASQSHEMGRHNRHQHQNHNGEL